MSPIMNNAPAVRLGDGSEPSGDGPIFSRRQFSMNKKNLLALAGALALMVGGCNSSSTPTQSSQTNSSMTVPSAPKSDLFGRGPEQETFDHVVVVIEENHSFDEVVGNANMPYLNNTLIPQGALMTDSHGATHPSEPNYLALFAGSFYGIQ